MGDAENDHKFSFAGDIVEVWMVPKVKSHSSLTPTSKRGSSPGFIEVTNHYISTHGYLLMYTLYNFSLVLENLYNLSFLLT